jgi:hypothetical protein
MATITLSAEQIALLSNIFSQVAAQSAAPVSAPAPQPVAKLVGRPKKGETAEQAKARRLAAGSNPFQAAPVKAAPAVAVPVTPAKRSKDEIKAANKDRAAAWREAVAAAGKDPRVIGVAVHKAAAAAQAAGLSYKDSFNAECVNQGVPTRY